MAWYLLWASAYVNVLRDPAGRDAKLGQDYEGVIVEVYKPL
jgi:hypothetical protein